MTAIPSTKAERTAYLKAHGWTRTESDGAQTWVSPDGREMGTLAWSIRRVLGVPLVGPFGAWLRDQTYRQDPVGDLARDYERRCPCPHCFGRHRRPTGVTGVRQELDAHNAIPGAYEALDRAEAEWQAATSADSTDRIVCDGCHATLVEISRVGHRGQCQSNGRHVGTWCDQSKPFPDCCRPQLAEGDLAPWPNP